MIEELKKHLQSVGKTDESWLDLAKRFNILPNGTNKQRSDKVRKVYNNITKLDLVIDPEVRNKEIFVNKITELLCTNKITPSEFQNYCNSYPNVPQPNTIMTTGTTNLWGSPSDYPFTAPFSNPYKNPYVHEEPAKVKSKDWEEFEKWKQSKNIQPVKRSEDGMHLVIGCAHCPYENQELVVKLCSFISDYKHKIAGFHLIGDFMNMGALSPHNDKTVDLTGYTLGQEYFAGNKLLDVFDSVLPKNIRKTYLGGNHEFWYDRYVSNIKNFKTADALPSPYDALKLVQRGYEVKTDWKEDFFIVGSYHLIHGLYCSTNPCKAHIDKLRQNVLFAHTHRVGQHFEGKLHGMNIGTLADINSEGFKYSSRIERQAWNNGFGVITVQGDYSQAELIVCTDNSFTYAGKKY